MFGAQGLGLVLGYISKPFAAASAGRASSSIQKPKTIHISRALTGMRVIRALGAYTGFYRGFTTEGSKALMVDRGQSSGFGDRKRGSVGELVRALVV